MKVFGIFFFLFIALSSYAQRNEFENAIVHGNWHLDFEQSDRLSTKPHEVGEKVILQKVPKRLKFKKDRPFRFKKNGTVRQPQTPPLSCGTISTFEALWYLKWKDASSWEIEEKDGDTIFRFQGLQLRLVESSKNEFTFVITD